MYFTYTEEKPISFNPFYTDDYVFDVEKKDSIKTCLLYTSLRVDGGGNILPVDGDGLPFLQHLTEPLGERLGLSLIHISASRPLIRSMNVILFGIITWFDF